ncbi:hypothetical protein DY218_16910 [Streptomyces triticagri]|uniref:Uncharacterized protein n=1 Tax=Streptomyces triticagri TaxID=2293568 RepID=A0A372M3K2_9ACTN|nr:hypothetical protein DY218_16910 [Streptomyces triticagri]
MTARAVDARHGSVDDRHGLADARHGSVDDRHGSADVRHGSAPDPLISLKSLSQRGSRVVGYGVMRHP